MNILLSIHEFIRNQSLEGRINGKVLQTFYRFALSLLPKLSLRILFHFSVKVISSRSVRRTGVAILLIATGGNRLVYRIQGLPTCLRRALVSLFAPCYISFSTGFEMVISFSLTASVEHRPGYIYSIFYTRNRVRIKQERNWRKSLLLFFFFSEFVNLYIYIKQRERKRVNFQLYSKLYRNARRLRRIPSFVFSLEEFTSRKFPSFPGALSIKASPSVTMERLSSAWKVARVEATRKDRVRTRRVICWVTKESRKNLERKISTENTTGWSLMIPKF